MPRLQQQDDVALAIDQELTSLRDHLSFTMERQIERLHDELLQELDALIKRAQPQKNGQPAPGLPSLIHTITDSKLHQMNLELRQHMTAKLDVLLQDMKDEQQAFQQDIQQQLDQRLALLSAPHPSRTGHRRWLNRLSAPVTGRLSNLPAWIACGILLIMLISWPT